MFDVTSLPRIMWTKHQILRECEVYCDALPEVYIYSWGDLLHRTGIATAHPLGLQDTIEVRYGVLGLLTCFRRRTISSSAAVPGRNLKLSLHT